MIVLKRPGRAFTLIEMLTVIAIIGILAGLLVPAIVTAMRNAKNKVAMAGIHLLSNAITAYQNVYGVPPPDSSVNFEPGVLDPHSFPDALSPNECLVWFLTREFGPGDASAEYAGEPWGTHLTNPAWNPATSTQVFSRSYCKVTFDMKSKDTRDYDGNGYKEFTDPWGRPFMYRAYPGPWKGIAAVYPVNGTGPYQVALRLNTAVFSGSTNYDVGGLYSTRGKITLKGFSNANYNGTFDFQGVQFSNGPLTYPPVVSNTVGDLILITFNSDPGAAAVSGQTQYVFPLHNANSGFDLYSLGPNGYTRAGYRPATGEWYPVDASSLADWIHVWGTPGDGNDIPTGDANNIITSEKDRDDISNW